jgi:hypothetical protein
MEGIQENFADLMVVMSIIMIEQQVMAIVITVNIKKGLKIMRMKITKTKALCKYCKQPLHKKFFLFNYCINNCSKNFKKYKQPKQPDIDVAVPDTILVQWYDTGIEREIADNIGIPYERVGMVLGEVGEVTGATEPTNENIIIVRLTNPPGTDVLMTAEEEILAGDYITAGRRPGTVRRADINTNNNEIIGIALGEVQTREFHQENPIEVPLPDPAVGYIPERPTDEEILERHYEGLPTRTLYETIRLERLLERQVSAAQEIRAYGTIGTNRIRTEDNQGVGALPIILGLETYLGLGDLIGQTVLIIYQQEWGREMIIKEIRFTGPDTTEFILEPRETYLRRMV